MQHEGGKVTGFQGRREAHTGFPKHQKCKYVCKAENRAQLSQINKVLSQKETGVNNMAGHEIDYEQFKIWHRISNPLSNHY